MARKIHRDYTNADNSHNVTISFLFVGEPSLLVNLSHHCCPPCQIMESNRQSSSVIYHNYSKCENSNCCFIVNSTHWETSSIWTSINICPSCSYCDSKRVYDDQICYHISYKFTFTIVDSIQYFYF